MPYRCFLSVAGIKFLLETDRPPVENEEFLPFFTRETDADVHAVIRQAESLLPVPERVLYTGDCCRIAAAGEGAFRKFFYETPEDPVCYAVATAHEAGREIRVDYLGEYSRCVSDLRGCFYLLGLEQILLGRNKLCLHASCVDTHLGGILFSGVSGIGKSTQADLWCRYRGARHINGDRPILSPGEGGWTAWGSPYAGSSGWHVNDGCGITAIVLLKQAKTCSLRRLSPGEAFRGVWAGLTVCSWDPSFVERASELTVDLIGRVPVYEFACTPDERAVALLERVLGKETEV